MSTAYKRGRGLSGIKLIVDCNDKCSSGCTNKQNKKCNKPRGYGNSFSNVYLRSGNKDLLNILSPGERYINGDLTVYGTRNSGFVYREASGSDPFIITNDYEGNYMFVLSVVCDCEPSNIIFFNIYINNMLQENLTGVLIPMQSTTQSTGSSSMSTNGILCLKKNSQIKVVISSDPGSSVINIYEFAMCITPA